MADQFFSFSKAHIAAAAVGILLLTVVGTPLVGAQGPKCLGKTVTITGTPGDDRLFGTSGADVIDGLGGNDVILGGSGEDYICGRDGNDVVRGGPGKDVLVGGSGNDELFGGTGFDSIFGGSGNDYSVGGAGGDAITSGTGDDRSYGGPGYDFIDGGPGADLIQGGSGQGILVGGDGDDTIYGGLTYDLISGGSGNDLIRGRGGIDSLDGQAGNDTIYGGSGNDAVSGGIGNDKLFGGNDDDSLIGLQGSDLLHGGDGVDQLIGGVGSDEIFGSSGTDLCDQDGNESPRTCENVRSVSYRNVEVEGKGTGIDYTGTYFGDLFYYGTIVRVFSYGASSEDIPVLVYESVVKGRDFTVPVPSGGGVLALNKDWGFPMVASGELNFDDDTKEPLEPVVTCCTNPYSSNASQAEVARLASSADAATQVGPEARALAQTGDSEQFPQLELTDEMRAETAE